MIEVQKPVDIELKTSFLGLKGRISALKDHRPPLCPWEHSSTRHESMRFSDLNIKPTGEVIDFDQHDFKRCE